jgi:DNA-binding transcriptional MocR family regulator
MSNWTPILEGLEGPLYLAIANQIKEAIERGELSPGTRLPTQRDLATQLGISIHTVSQAYAEAERRGLVTGEIGRGTFVTAGAGEREAPFIVDRRSDDLIDLSINRPVCGQVHEERIRAALADLAERGDVSSMLVCRPIVGRDHHRLAAATWLRRRQIAASAEQILICNGAAHGLLVAFATLTRPGDLVLTEALVDHGTIGLANVLHFRLEGLPIDDEGILPEAFEAACLEQEVKVLCTTPCLNNPTASVMGPERRAQIAAIARRHGVTIIENDVYGMLLPDAPPPIWTYLPERTYYVTSFTKITVSGLRTGYLLAPSEAVPRLVRALRTTSWMATPLVAELATRWIQDGTADELVQWQREQLAMRHAVVDEALAGFDYASRRNGLHLWLTLPEHWRAEGLVAEARLRNVAITPAEPFTVQREAAINAVRISIGAARTETQLRQGLEFVTDMLKREPEPFYMPV